MWARRLLLGQLVLRPADHDLALVAHVGLERLAQGERARHAVDQRHHVHAEGRLHRRVLVELVEHDLGDRVALELDHQPHAALVGLVVDVGDLQQLLLAVQIGDLLDQPAVTALLDHVGQLGDDDRLLALLERLDVRARLHADAASPGGIRVANPARAEDHAAGGEVGALDVGHQALDVGVGIVDQRDGRGDRLTQIVRRDVRRHAHGDPRGAVDQQVGEARGQHQRLLALAVVGGREVDGVGVEVAQHLGGDARQPRLGVAHRCGRVVVDRAEVPLGVGQRIAHGEVLRQTHERVVDRRVAVRVVALHDLADDAGGLAERAVGLEALLVHRVEHAAVDGFEAVAGVGQGAADDHRHRVVEVGGLHLLLEPARLDVAATQRVGPVCHLPTPLLRRRGW